MKTILITECGAAPAASDFILDLEKLSVKGCTGCWTCWWATPGKCISKDLDQFYHHYVTANKALYFAKVTKGFVSSNLKSLFDRMLPLYLPYVSYSTGESMHVKRYERYPDIEFYYQGEFEKEEDRKIFEDYINRVFYQFHSEKITVKPIEEYLSEGGSRV